VLLYVVRSLGDKSTKVKVIKGLGEEGFASQLQNDPNGLIGILCL
jgi:hypothetical protein